MKNKEKQMGKWEENKYIIEAKLDIIEASTKYDTYERLFKKYEKQVMKLHPKLHDWLESGFNQSQFYNQMTIDNNEDYLADSKRAYDNRVAGAKKAAETRKANKLKLAK
jgi:hypothetical protein